VCDSVQYGVRLVTDTTVAIISCWRRLSGRSGDMSDPNVANAWCSASGMSECAATMPAISSSCGRTGASYSAG
jgi:hypothetical protein